jgi:1-phosphofructokinase
LIKRLKAKGARVFFDATGDALRLGCAEAPFLVKPNAEEAETFVGFKISNHEDGKRAVLPFLRMGIEYVALTIGDLGLLLATQKEMVWAVPPKVPVRNVTGAGDALMAGMVVAITRRHDLNEVARWGVAAGTVSVMHEGVSQLPIEEFKMMLGRVDTRVINVM